MNAFALAAALAISSASATAATNLVSNGSFEASAQPASSWSQKSSIPGWTVGLRGVELRNHMVGSAFDGNTFVELDTTGNSFIAQCISTTTGQHYTLSLAYSARPGTASLAAHTNDILVMWDAKPVTVLSAVNATSENLWKTYTFDLVGTNGHSSVLSFWALGKSDSYGGSLDNVSLTSAVPEPGTYGMMLAGLGAVVLIALRKSRKIR